MLHLLLVVELDNLRFFAPNLDTFLLCRILPRPRALSTPLNPVIKLLVASPSSSSILLELHNYPLLPSSLGRPTSSDIDAVFSPDSFLIIKEPKLRSNQMDEMEDELLLKVDGPADVVMLERDSKLLEGVEWKTGRRGGGGGKAWQAPEEVQQTLEEWKTQGNEVKSAARSSTLTWTRPNIICSPSLPAVSSLLSFTTLQALDSIHLTHNSISSSLIDPKPTSSSKNSPPLLPTPTELSP